MINDKGGVSRSVQELYERRKKVCYAYSWTPKATKAIEHLKEAMCKAPVLATPDFTKPLLWNVMLQEMELVLF